MMNHTEYDVAIVGAGLGGCAAAMLFARRGATVALIERERASTAFKKTCTHTIQASAVPTLERMGLRACIEAAGAAKIELSAWTRWGWLRKPAATSDAVSDHGFNLRREKLDPMVRQFAANTAGVDFMPGYSLRELRLEPGNRAEMKIESAHAPQRAITARLVIGADGRNSRVGQLAGVPAKIKPHGRFSYYAYYSNLPLAFGGTAQAWFLDPDWASAFACDDGLVVVGVMLPRQKLDWWKSDIEGNMLRVFDTLRQGPDLRAAKRESQFMGVIDLPNLSRPAAQPGVAFVGDAALAADPLWGVGCGFAFQSAEWLVDSVADALGGRGNLDRALGNYRRRHRWALAGHAYLMADYSTGRSFNFMEKLFYSAAARDRDFAAHVIAFAERNISVSRFIAPHALARALGINISYLIKREHAPDPEELREPHRL